MRKENKIMLQIFLYGLLIVVIIVALLAAIYCLGSLLEALINKEN